MIENIPLLDNSNVLNIGFGINIVSNPTNTLYPSTNLNIQGVNTNSKDVIKIFFKNLKILEEIYIRKGINEIYRIWSLLAHKIGEPISVKIGEKKDFRNFNGLNKDGGL